MVSRQRGELREGTGKIGSKLRLKYFSSFEFTVCDLLVTHEGYRNWQMNTTEGKSDRGNEEEQTVGAKLAVIVSKHKHTRLTQTFQH